MTPALFTALFVTALAVSVVIQRWLSRRQVRHVLAHRAAVPVHFADRVTLAAHQKAADYTVARTRLGLVDLLLDTVVLLALTLAGGLALIAGWLGETRLPSLAQDLALIVVVAIFAGGLALPLAWDRTFLIEVRFCFHLTTHSLWISAL